MSIRTIEAPGVEIVEKDISDYTVNSGGSAALVMGYANQGQSYETVNLTSKTSLVNYFGKPTNEAERYFFAACSEVLAQNGKLFAAKLPYDNASTDKHIVAQYKVATDGNPSEISSLTDVLSINNETIYGDTTLSTNSAFANDLRDTFFGGFRATESDTDLVTSILSTSVPSEIYERIAGVFKNPRDMFVSDNGIVGSTGIYVNSSAISNYIVRNDADYSPFDISSSISVENGEVSSYFTREEYENVDILPTKYYTNRFSKICVGSDSQAVLFTSKEKNIIDRIYESFDEFSNVKLIYRNATYLRYNLNDVSVVDSDTILILNRNGLKKSVDGGNTFTLVNAFEDYYGCDCIATKNGTNIFAIVDTEDEGYNQIIKSTDGGQTWQSQLTIEDVYFTDIDTLDGTVAVAVDTEGNVYKVSSGSSWTIVSSEALGENCTAIAIKNANTIYVIQNGILLKSANGGSSFSEANSDEEFVDVAVDVGSSNSIYAITETQILRTTVGNESDFEVVREINTSSPIDEQDVRGYKEITQAEYDELDPEEQALYRRSPGSSFIWNDMTALVKEVLSTASITRFAEYFSQSELSSVISDSFKSQKNAYSLIRSLDDSVSTCNEITFNPSLSAITTDELDYLVTGEQFLTDGNFVIVDKLGGQYSKTSDGKEVVGLIPVITTATNAMYFQNMLDSSDSVADVYSCTSAIYNNTGENGASTLMAGDLAIPFSGNPLTTDSLSERACNYFPQIGFLGENQLDREYLKDIGVVVFRAFVDSSASNKVNFEVVEAFVGSLDKKAKNPATNVTKYIKTIVNTQSEYIYLFANVDGSKLTGDILAISEQPVKSMGFTAEELKKDISIKSINDSMEIIFQKNADIHEKSIDYVIDAGVSNIAQYIACVYGTENGAKGPYDPAGENAKMFKLRSNEDRQAWFNILTKYNTFCSKTRKDCMFFADGLRSLCLTGSKKVVRSTKPNNTIDSSILPNLKFLAGMNTSHGAGFCDWFMIADEFTGETFWCPPSIQAAGCYIFTDNTYSFWDAAAGLKRGVITALDCAFSPTIKQAGVIYTGNSWNYAIDYADVGIILEGQKTLTKRTSAFDRANVRRLFNRLERTVYNLARQFVYEPNTAYTRQRFVDRLTPIFQDVQSRGGIYDFRIVCDERINTPEVIDNNELRAKIGIKPTKTAEFLYIEFYALRTGGDFEEMFVS